MAKEVFFIDQVSVERPCSDQALSDAKKILQKDGSATLRVVIDATHSGVLTNRRVYPARKVVAGYKSFFSTDSGGSAAYDKPILLHHNDYSDSVGRVRLADFKALKSGLEFDKDYLFPDLQGGKGSGVVVVHADITDKNAIEKILDGRYLSVSAGHSTDQMYCSICAKSLYSETCTHIPGYRYNEEGERVDDGDASEDAKLCYGVTNNMTYHELSFVNTPAQPHAKITEFDWKLGKDALRHEIDNQYALISVNRAKKEIVHSLSVLTDNFEFSLLTGKDKPNKIKTYSVSASTAKLLEKQLDQGQGTNDESIDDRPSSSQESFEKVVSSDKNEVKKQKEDSVENKKIEEIKEDKSNMDEKMKDEIARLTSEIETLKKDLATAVKTKDDLSAITVAKDSEIASLKVSVDALKSEVALSLATALASHRIRLAKPDTKGLDSTDAKKKYIETLAKRSLESLKDSINDLLVEIDLTDAEKKQEPIVNKATAGEILEEKKVDSNIPTHDSGRKVQVKKDNQKDILATIIN